MAIAFDAISYGESGTLTTTFSHTVTGSNPIIFVGVNVNSTSDKITGVTYNGVSMTRVVLTAAFGSTRSVLYVLANPSTGANNVVVTSSDTTYRWCSAASYTDANATGQPDASSSTTASGTTVTGTLTTIANNCWTIGFFYNNANTNFSAGASTTLRGSGFFTFLDSNAAKTPAGSVSIVGNWTNSNTGAVALASIAPFVASARSRLLLLGVA